MEKTKSTKKTIIIVVCAIVVLLLLATAIIVNIVGNQEITKEEAINIALDNAEVTATDVSGLVGYLNMDDGIGIYDIQFYYDGFEYEYEVSAATGKILDISTEKTGFNIPDGETFDTSKYIGEDKAKQIAYDNAGVSEVSFVRVHLDQDDGIVYYDVEFRSGDYEYNYDIDAISGKLLEKDIDKEIF